MDFILKGVTGLLRTMSAVLGNFSWTRNLAGDIATIADYIQRANAYLPIATALTILALFLSLYLILIAYYWITRALNLLRGAG